VAARPWRVITFTLALLLTVWVWALAGVLFSIRWNAIERLGPPLRQLFPYGELRIGVDASNPPFAVATADDLFGLEIDLGRALAERIGIPVRFVNMGYDGLYDSIRADQVDIVISTLTIDPLRTRDVLYTREYFNAGMLLVSDAARPISSMDGLGNHSLAFEFGSDADSYSRLWLRRILPFERQPYELPQYALDAVRLGHADAAFVDATSTRLYLRNHHDWQAAVSDITYNPYVIAARIDRWDMWAKVNITLQQLADDGTLQTIINNWL
jgi:arginine/lysine/histidine transporter system substrate-binding protein